MPATSDGTMLYAWKDVVYYAARGECAAARRAEGRALALRAARARDGGRDYDDIRLEAGKASRRMRRRCPR